MIYRDNGLAVAREAWPFVLPLLIATLLGLLAGMFVVAVIVGLIALAVIVFFRNPVRTAPSGDGLVIAPADGKVVAAGIVEHPDFPGGQALRIGVFMSLLDVHMNWSPCAGRIIAAEHHPGRFLNAMEDKASVENERKVLRMEHPSGAPVVVKLVAGLVARRIVCPAAAGDEVGVGQKIGLIRFGSRVEVLVPATSELRISLNMRVRGGETVVACLPSQTAETGDGVR